MRMSRSLSQGAGRQWMQRQSQDPFVIKARQDGYVARSAYKLLHIDDRFRLFDRQHTRIVMDLGSSPGGWCQVIRERAGDRCFLLGVDLLPVKAQIPNAVLVQGDFTLPAVQHKLRRHLADHWAASSPARQRDYPASPPHPTPSASSSSFTAVDVVTSDMCPNRMGGTPDGQRIAQLNMQAIHVCVPLLRKGGHFVCKVLGSRAVYAEVWQSLARHFLTVHTCKPPASRLHSDEMFLVGLEKLELPRAASAILPSRHQLFGVTPASSTLASGGDSTGARDHFDLDSWPGFHRRGRRRE